MRENVNIAWEGDFWLVQLNVRKPPRGSWVSPGCVWDSNAKAMPTLTRALPSDTPPRFPAGIERASTTAVARWIEDKHCFQVYQYEEELLVTSVSAGDKRLPDASEREILMGFDVGYTSVAVAEKASARNTFVTRAELIGNSFHVPTISYLLGELLLGQNLV